MEDSSSDPQSKGICASKERVHVGFWLYGILAIMNVPFCSGKLTLGDGMLKHYFSYIFIYGNSYEHQQQKR